MSDSGAAFLAVTRSARGRLWRDRLDAAGLRRAQAIAQTHGLPDILARILAGRGVDVTEVEGFLNPRLRDLLPDPSVLRDMDAATARLASAVATGERVAIFGDYDVDGACSAALLAGFLIAHGVRARIHIPDRLTEGYGPNPEAIRMLAGEGAGLLVTVDCGTTSHETLAEAKKLGMDVVVLDHHQAGESLPEVAALVNPNRQDDLSGLGHLCAAGVVFVTLVSLARALREAGSGVAYDLLADLDLVALATVADVVPLTGLNRAFVRQGLTIMAGRRRLGLRALMDVAGLSEPPSPYHLGFLIGPRINAGGRIGDAALGSRLLLTQDEAEARKIAGDLDRLNRERQAVEQAMLAEAEGEALRQAGLDGEGARVLIVGGDDWHPGIVGLVASRLKERYARPAFALAYNGEGIGTGSARSVAGVDIGKAVREAVARGLLIKGGGHAMAAGITLERARLADFTAFLSDTLAQSLQDAAARDALDIDAAVTASGATPALYEAMAQAGPFGQANPEPVLVLPAHRISDCLRVGENHLRARLRGSDGGTLNAIAFRALGTPLGEAMQQAGDTPMHVAVNLTRDRRSLNARVEARIVDVAKRE